MTTSPTDTKTAAKRATEYRHYLIIDDSVGWFMRIVRQEIDPNKSAKMGSEPEVVSQEVADCPTWDPPFIGNILARERAAKSIRYDGTGHCTWSISPAEYERIQRLIQLWPAVQEYERLAGYNV